MMVEDWEERLRSSMAFVLQAWAARWVVVSRSSWKELVWKDDDLGFGAADFEVHVG